MSLTNILQLAGSAMNAQTVRLNTIASNLANVDVVAGSAKEAFKAKHPVFKTVLNEAKNGMPESYGVQVTEIMESSATNPQIFDPTNRLANKEGFVYRSNVNPLEEMADMLIASRAYESSVTTASTARELIMRTLDMNTK